MDDLDYLRVPFDAEKRARLDQQVQEIREKQLRDFETLVDTTRKHR